MGEPLQRARCAVHPVYLVLSVAFNQAPDWSFFLGGPMALLMLPVLRRVDEVTSPAVREERSPWGVRHGIVIVLAIAFWGLMFVGLFLEPV